MTENKKLTFNGMTFSYEDKIVEVFDLAEQVEVYIKITILESNNPKFKKGDLIDQISIESKIHFEHEDGTPY